MITLWLRYIQVITLSLRHSWLSGGIYWVYSYLTIKVGLYPFLIVFTWGLLILNRVYRLVRFLTAVETNLVGKAMVDWVWPNIKYTNIWPLEGSVGVFISILCLFSLILTTCSAKRPTYGLFLHSRTVFMQRVLQALNYLFSQDL